MGASGGNIRIKRRTNGFAGLIDRTLVSFLFKASKRAYSRNALTRSGEHATVTVRAEEKILLVFTTCKPAFRMRNELSGGTDRR